MAAPDHRALAHLSNRLDAISTAIPGCPPYAPEAVEAAPPRYRSKAEGIAVAVSAITRLLADSDAYRHAQANDLPADPSRWPLTSVYADGLWAALHYLNQHAKTLGREPRSER